MTGNRGNGYARLPALLLAGAFLLPLLSRVIAWLGLPREVHFALPVLLGVWAIAGIGSWRPIRRTGRTPVPAQSKAELSAPSGEADPTGESI